MAEVDTESTNAFSFLTKKDDDTFGALNLTERPILEASANNKLIEALGVDFLSNGIVFPAEVAAKVEIIKSAFEDAAGLDEELIEAIVHNDFALVSFLLTIAINSEENEHLTSSEDTAARCLAFSGDILYSLWTDLCVSPNRLLLVLQATKKAASRITKLVSEMPDKARPNSQGYLGYDERDMVDYDNEGYGYDNQEDKTFLEELTATMQDNISVWFLILYQVFAQPMPQVSKKIISCRTRKNNRYSSRRLAKLKETSELVSDVHTTSELDHLDLVVFFTDLVGVLIDLLSRHRLVEDAHNMCVKVVACVNAQMPRLQHADTNEVATAFAAADSGESGENLSQGLLYLLNENGYPHIHNSETIASIRLCRDLLNVEKPEVEEEEDGILLNNNYARGHFYTNDVKVMVDIIVRELCNIPHNTSGINGLSDLDNHTDTGGSSNSSSSSSSSKKRRSTSRAELIQHITHGTVRFAYLELLDAIINKSSWSSSGDCYMKDQLKSLLEETSLREDERNRLFAQDLLAKYDYYLS